MTKDPAASKSPFATTGVGGRSLLRRVPVWVWRSLMAVVGPKELVHLNEDPLTGLVHHDDIDFVGDGIPAHRLDVIHPDRHDAGLSPSTATLPVYVYFHGGGWTSGDKASLTKYCASQALSGMVVVNVNYRMASRRHNMTHMLHDANAALAWVRANVASFGGDPDRIVLGGDSAGGQIASLLAATESQPKLASHFDIVPAVGADSIRGLVLHCSALDFSEHFRRGFILSHNFTRMLIPGRGRYDADGLELSRAKRARALRRAARFLSPIEWLDESFPAVFISTSERDFFYGANLNFMARLRRHDVPLDSLVYAASNSNTEHTWQQNYRYPESQEVYRRLQAFVHRVAAPRTALLQSPLPGTLLAA